MSWLTAPTNTNKNYSFTDWLQNMKATVDCRLQHLLSRQTISPPLTNAMTDSVLNGGKRLRPAVLFAVAQQENNISERAVDAACAVELMHCYSLIHDDMPCMDDDDTRRGRPACHKAHGDALALLAGDCLQSLAFETLANSGLAAPAVARLALAAGASGMGGGQALDIGNAADNEDKLRAMHQLKTGMLFNCALQLGLMCRSDADDTKLQAAIGRFGDAFGLLFQIANDLQDETQDRRGDKITYVTLLSRERAKTRAQSVKQQAIDAAGDFPYLVDIIHTVYL